MQTESIPHLPTNHVFVDLENVKVIDLSVIGGKNLILHLFIGPNNKKLDIEVVELLLEHAQAVKMIRSPKAGKNALDFVLAYHLGQAVLGDPKGYFHIVSKDTGFDALVELLKSRHVKVKRHDDWSGLHFNSAPKPPSEPKAPEIVVKAPAPKPPETVAKAPAPKPLSAGAEKLLENLRKSVKNRPLRKQTLVNHAKSSLGKEATPEMGERVVGELQKAGYLAIDNKGAVSYKL
jgi:hypothetical protein